MQIMTYMSIAAPEQSASRPQSAWLVANYWLHGDDHRRISTVLCFLILQFLKNDALSLMWRELDTPQPSTPAPRGKVLRQRYSYDIPTIFSSVRVYWCKNHSFRRHCAGLWNVGPGSGIWLKSLTWYSGPWAGCNAER